MPKQDPREDPASLYRLLATTHDPSTALLEALAACLGKDASDPEALILAAHDAVRRAQLPEGVVEELRMQIRFIGVAAVTGADIISLKPGDPGWSETYEEVRALYYRYRAIAELHGSLPWPLITAYDLWADIKKALKR